MSARLRLRTPTRAPRHWHGTDLDGVVWHDRSIVRLQGHLDRTNAAIRLRRLDEGLPGEPPGHQQRTRYLRRPEGRPIPDPAAGPLFAGG